MAAIHELCCVVSGRSYAPDEVQYTSDLGQVGTLDVLYDYETLRAQLDRDRIAAGRDMTMWRYRPLLPLADETPVPPLSAGWSPLYDAPRLAQVMGLRQVWVKDDGQNPTGSLKDRASAMVLARAQEQGLRVVSTASTGNAAAALAGLGASMPGLDIVIFVPAAAPEAKIAQLLVYGAQVLLVESDYDTAFDLCLQTCEEQGWYCRNTGINPFTTEGKKTVALEMAEQLGWEVPDVVLVPVGDGSIIGGVHKGFVDLHRLGWITRVPRLIGVQAAGSAALAQAWGQGTPPEDMQPIVADTIADSISSGLPRDRAKALRAVRETGGAFVIVTDEEIVAAIPQLARLTGVFAEPAAAASFAGAQRAVQSKLIQTDEKLVLLVTGNGLKDVRRAQQSVTGGLRVAGHMEAVRQSLYKIKMQNI